MVKVMGVERDGEMERYSLEVQVRKQIQELMENVNRKATAD